MVGFKLLLHYRDYRIVPGIMEILLHRLHVDTLARPSSIRARNGMQRLVDVTDEVNEKREVAGGPSFVVIPIPKPTKRPLSGVANVRSGDLNGGVHSDSAH